MKTKIQIILSVLLITASVSGVLAKGTIIGVVRDAQSNEGLPGANVQVEGTVLGASTNVKGAFMIRKVPTGVYNLRISMIGYRTFRVTRVQVVEGDNAVVAVKLTESPVEIDPVVVTASKWAQEAASTPSSIEVITTKEILKRNPIQIQDVLKTATGVQIMQENVNIRGSDGFTFGIGSRVLVMLDGVPLTTTDLGSVNWFMVSPSDLARVEVVRGAGSAIYGSSAMGGVVNFITQKPSQASRTYVRTMAGMHDEFDQEGWDWSKDAMHFNRIDFTHSRKIGKLGVRISGGRNYSTGYLENASYERYNLSGKFIYNFDDGGELSFFSNYMFDKSDVFVLWQSQRQATFITANQLGKHQERNGITLFGKYSRALSSKAAVEINAYLNRFLLGIQVSSVDFTPALGIGGAIQGTYIPTNSLSFIWGTDFKIDNAESDVYGKRDAYLVAPYLQADLKLGGKVNLTSGIRYDRYELTETDSIFLLPDARVFDRVTPKFGINYRPFESTTLKASVSNGFKFPVIFQLYFDDEVENIRFVPNPTLDSETSWSYEVGLNQNVTQNWFFEVNAFYSQVRGLIQPIASGVTASFENTPKVAIPGIEVMTTGRWWQERLGLRLNLTYMDPHNEDTDELLLHRQKLIAFAGASLRFGSVEFQTDFKYGSAQEGYLLPGEHEFLDQKVLDARVFYYLGGYTFVAGVNNIFNYAYTLREQHLEENRSFVVGMSAAF